MNDILYAYMVWFIVTTIWGFLKKEKSKELLFRYGFTFILFTCLMYFFFSIFNK